MAETLADQANRSPEVRGILENLSLTNYAAAELLGVWESSVRRWRRRYLAVSPVADFQPNTRPGAESGIVSPELFGADDRQKIHERLDLVLDDANFGPGQVKGLRVKQWEMGTKDADGNPQVTQLQGVTLDVKVNDLAPEWPLVDRPAFKISYTPAGSPAPKHKKDKVAVILPDPQLGYRLYANGELDPFHDESAIEVAFQITADLDPDLAVCLGDFEDFAEFSRFAQEPSFARTTQLGIDRGYEFVAQLRAAARNARNVVLEGNHDRRTEKRILEHNMSAWGLKRAADTTGWPVFSVPYLCAFDEWDTEYIGGYPSGELWINDRLRCIHGIKTRSNSSTAAAVVKDEGVSTIFGHIHRLETQYVTERTRTGHRTRVAVSPGCLCRIDGSVPSTKSSTDLSGRPVKSAENWQQGMAVVNYREGNGSFNVDTIFINTQEGHEARYGGKVYKARGLKRSKSAV